MKKQHISQEQVLRHPVPALLLTDSVVRWCRNLFLQRLAAIEQGCIEIRREDFQLFAFVFQIGNHGFPVVVDMQGQRNQKQKPGVDMDVAPVRLGQSPQPPFGPVGDAPRGNDVQDNAGEHHEYKRHQRGKGGNFSQLHFYVVSPFLVVL